MEVSVAVQQEIAQMVIATLQEHLAAVPERAQVRFADREGAVEGALCAVGGQCLERVVAEVGMGYEGAQRRYGCGGTQETDHDVRARWQTVLGTIAIRRAAYRCPTCGRQALPLDSQFGLPADRTSPVLRARLSRFCTVAPRRYLRRGPLPNAGGQHSPGDGRRAQHGHRPAAPERRAQHRRRDVPSRRATARGPRLDRHHSRLLNDPILFL